jgi:hypothetical protein
MHGSARRSTEISGAGAPARLAYDAAVPTIRALLAATLILAGSCSSEPPAEPSAPPRPAATTPPPVATEAPPPAVAIDAAPAEAPLPGTAKELELARKTAILESRYADAVRLCAAEDMAAIGEQGVMSCVLSACRQSDGEKAAAWGKRLGGQLKAQARKVCAASGVPL